jgi:hypothetical protein
VTVAPNLVTVLIDRPDKIEGVAFHASYPKDAVSYLSVLCYGKTRKHASVPY